MSASDYPNGHWLIDTEALAARLDDPNVRILDGTVHLVPDGAHGFRAVSARPDYDEGHIPGAAFVDLQGELSDPSSRLRFTLPSADRFAAVMSNLGIGPGVHVVVYSATTPWWASRLWWMFRVFGFDDVAVLNGGLAKWQAEGRPLNRQAPSFAPAAFEARFRPELIADKARVRAAVDKAGSVTVNALSASQHDGSSETHYGRPGRIAGSVNVSAMHLIDKASQTLLPADQLRAAVGAKVAADSGEVICYCGGGIAATMDAFAMALLGRDDVAVYDASLQEWANDPEMPMQTGPE